MSNFPHFTRRTIFHGQPAERVLLVVGDPHGNDSHPPQQRIFFNRQGQLVEHSIDSGLGTHEAKAIVLDGQVGIVGKPYRGLKSPHPRTPDIDGVQLWMPEQ